MAIQKKNIQEKINIPRQYKNSDRVAISQDIINYIIKRSKRGLDKNNEKFTEYSEAYKKSIDFKIARKKGKPVNLTLTKEMLRELDLISHKTGEIIIGYDPDDSDLAGKVEGNVIGSYGNPSGKASKARDFIGLTDSDLQKILKKHKPPPDKKTASQKEIAAYEKRKKIREAISEATEKVKKEVKIKAVTDEELFDESIK